MPNLQINGLTIYYGDKGSGPILILLHAFPTDCRMWAAQLDELSSRYRVITPDFPGFGQSSPGGPFTIPELADTIHAFIGMIPKSGQDIGGTSTPPRKPILGGLSMGGYVAMNYARQYSDELGGLILADTKDAADNPEQRENRNRMIEVAKSKGSHAIADMMMGKMLAPDAETSRPAVAKSLRAMMESCPSQTIVQALAALRDRPDMTDALPKIIIPTLILVGDSDAITPPTIAESMQKKIPGSQLAIIPGAGHMSAMEQPTLVSRAIGKFMADLESDTGNHDRN